MTRTLVSATLAATIAATLALAGCNKPAGKDPEMAQVLQRLDATERELTRLQDVNAVEKLTRSYGYYIDKGLWDQVVDLFADDSTVEIEAGGIYAGKAGADRLF